MLDPGIPVALSERSEFSDWPGRVRGTREARRAGEAGYVSLVTFLSYHKKVTRPPGRDPARSLIQKREAVSSLDSGFDTPRSGIQVVQSPPE